MQLGLKTLMLPYVSKKIMISVSRKLTSQSLAATAAYFLRGNPFAPRKIARH